MNLRQYGAVPFWFWNGDQREEELALQMELGAKWGLRGFAIHGRTGNKTPYLSSRWFQLVRFCCQQALRLGLEIWIYDEEGYPSGCVGDRLPALDPSYRQQYLYFTWTTAGEAKKTQELVRVFPLDNLIRPCQVSALPDDAPVLAFSIRYWDRYIDTLNPEVVELFISLTHERYAQELGEYFGNPITHFYTDDVGFHHLHQGLAYTPGLPERFFREYGYDLLDHLPALVIDLPGCERVRWDYRRLVTELFLSTFQDRLYYWCEARGVKSTGHLFNDEGDLSRIVNSLGSTMQFYAREHVPGIDDYFIRLLDGAYLREIRNPNGVCPVPLYKQASSVANQLKDGICSGEILTYLGWSVSLREQQLLLNFAHLLGINLLTHHAFYYTVGGVAKRDCPPSYFFQQPYWEISSRFQKKLAHTTRLLTRGSFYGEVLILHPISSAWILQDGSDIRRDFQVPPELLPYTPKPRCLDLEDAFAKLSLKLLQNRVGFEYGDEEILAKHASVGPGFLQVGKMRYTTVIVPPVVNLYASTVKLLQQFSAAGGRLIFVDPPQHLFIDGCPAEAPVVGEKELALFPHGEVDSQAMSLINSLPPDVELISPAGDDLSDVAVHTRLVDGKREFFLVNMSGEYRSVALVTSGPWALYDPETDQTIFVGPDFPQGFTLPPWGACHVLPGELEGLVIPPATPEGLVRSVFLNRQGRERRRIDRWRVWRERENICVLDYCEVPGQGPRLLRELDGWPRKPEQIAVKFWLSTTRVHDLLGENLDRYTMRLNGQPLVPEADYRHPSNRELQRVPIGHAVQLGLNTLEVALGGWQQPLENLYLLGDFEVRLEERETGWYPVVVPTEEPTLGDLTLQGLPFYWGSVVYETSLVLERVTSDEWLDLGQVEGVVELWVNGEEVGVRMYPPYGFFLGDKLRVGSNEIRIRLYNTAQNLYGPHRNREIMRAVVPPGDEGRTLKDCYSVAPFGIHGPVVLRGGLGE